VPAAAPGGEARQALAAGIGCYLIWGVVPLYFQLRGHQGAGGWEILAHRTAWAAPAAFAMVLVARQQGHLAEVLRSPRTLGWLFLSSLAIAANWVVFIFAVNNGQLLESSLGYYINPLVSIVVAAVLLGERLDRLQMAAVALAAIAVTVLTVEAGKLPWVSLALAFSFAAYGFFRKTLPIGPSQGFLLEVLLLSVPALCYLVYLIATGQDHLVSSTGADTMLLIGCGPVTAVPLLFFAFGARLLRLSTIGIMQYIAPTMVFLIAVLVFHEPFGTTEATAFVLIWTALAMYSWSMFRGRDRQPAPATR
jgi:chloramphenicol-sensitive protein RarD